MYIYTFPHPVYLLNVLNNVYDLYFVFYLYRVTSWQLKWWLNMFALYGMLGVAQEKCSTLLNWSLGSQQRKEIGIIFR
jgi:hypothetical protein